jgi:hypothetical protein
VRKSSLHYDAGEEIDQCQNEEEKWCILEAARPNIMASRPCFVASQPYTNSKVALMALESVWWHWITLYCSGSNGDDLKLLKFSIFKVFSYYPCLNFILSMITMC